MYSPGSDGGCGCGVEEDGEVLTSGTAAVEGERETTIKTRHGDLEEGTKLSNQKAIPLIHVM